MAIKQLRVLLAVAIGFASLPAAAAGNCPFLPDYEQLRQQLPGMPPAQAAAALEQYSRTHENPEACEAIEIEQQLGSVERSLFTMGIAEHRVAAHAVYRCHRVEPRTARCEGMVEDGTAHPLSQGRPPALPLESSATVDFKTDRPGATLHRVYMVTLADALDGKAARRLVMRRGKVQILSGTRSVAIIAIFRTSNSPWRFRKAVWWVL